MAKYLPLIMLALLVISANSRSETDQDKILSLLRDINEEINQLTISISENEVGWWDLEIFTCSQTSDFEQRYLKLKNRLDPALTIAVQDVRKRTTKLKTMGQALSSIPGLVSDMLTIVDYETRLNHIEFLIISRRATISTRLSIVIASVLGIIGVLLGVVSVWRDAKVDRRFREIDQQNEQILSMLERFQRVLSRRCRLRYSRRRFPSK